MKPTILGICENKAISFLLETVLSTEYTFIHSSDIYGGMGALKKVGEIELVLIDVDQQIAEKIEFIQHINTSLLYKRPITLLVSDGQFGEKFNQVCKVCDIIYKPFSPLELTKSINKILYSMTPVN